MSEGRHCLSSQLCRGGDGGIRREGGGEKERPRMLCHASS